MDIRNANQPLHTYMPQNDQLVGLLTTAVANFGIAMNKLHQGEFAEARMLPAELPAGTEMAKHLAITIGIPRALALARLVDSLRKKAHSSDVSKIAWNAALHPRWAAGSTVGHGGEFAPAGSEDTDGEPNTIPVQLTTPWVEPWEQPFRIPVPPSDGNPGPLALPRAVPREGIPQNPFPRRREYVEEWKAAEKYCMGLWMKGQLGEGDHREAGRTIAQCIMGQVSEKCGGNPKA